MEIKQELRVLDNREPSDVCGDCVYFRRNKYCTFDPPQVIPNLTNGQYPVVKTDSPSCGKFSRWDASLFVNMISSAFSYRDILDRKFVFSVPYTPYQPPPSVQESETQSMKNTLYAMASNPFIVGSVPFIRQFQPEMASSCFGRAAYCRVFIGRLGLSFLPSHALILGAWLMNVAASTGYLDSGLTAKLEMGLDSILEFTERIIREYGPTMEADSVMENTPMRIEQHAVLHAPTRPTRYEDRFNNPLAGLMDSGSSLDLYTSTSTGTDPVKPS